MLTLSPAILATSIPNDQLPGFAAGTSADSVPKLHGLHVQTRKHAPDVWMIIEADEHRAVYVACELRHALVFSVRKVDAETQVLFEFIAHRYESGSLIITANQPFSAWDQVFPDAIMTVAAIDRLIHHASILEMEGESYRKTQRMNEPKP